MENRIKLLGLLLVAVILVSGCASGKNISLDQTGNREAPVRFANNYYRFDPQLYQNALDEKKVVMLFFKANWCLTCLESAQAIKKVFNSDNYKEVIGFEIHYNDEESRTFDEEMIKKYQIAYQNAMVILNRNGEEAFRTLAYITEEKIRNGIGKALAS